VSEGSVGNITKTHIHGFYLLGGVRDYGYVLLLQTKPEELQTRITEAHAIRFTISPKTVSGV
jgi:hypothetical protein